MLDRKAILTQEHKDHLKSYGYQVVDQVTIGPYDLVLTRFALLGNSYHLAMQKDGQDFADAEQQMEKYPGSIEAKPSEFIPIINKWIQKYGVLYVSSNNRRKARIYEKILKHLGYQTETMDLFGSLITTIETPAPINPIATIRFNIV